MYTLVSRLAEDRGRDELQTRFEAHVYSQGVAAIEKCGESAQNVSGLLTYQGVNRLAIQGGIVGRREANAPQGFQSPSQVHCYMYIPLLPVPNVPPPPLH